MNAPLLSALVLALPLGAAPQDAPAQGPPSEAQQALAAALEQGGVQVDLAAGAAAIDATVLVKGDLLEYLLVGPGGAGHESLFATDVMPSLLNAGLLALGAQPGTNAVWSAVDPPPTLEERRAGRRPFTVAPPSGDGFYLYAAWREGGETYLYRVEDLIANLRTGRAMARHRFVYLGSAFVAPEPGGEEVFAADLERNLVNIAFFREGHTLATAALADCVDQSIWVANAFLVPHRDAPVRLIFAREPLVELPPALLERLPVVVTAVESVEREDG